MTTETNKIYDFYRSNNHLTMNYNVWNCGSGNEYEVEENHSFLSKKDADEHSKVALEEYDDNYDWYQTIYDEVVDNLDIEPETNTIHKEQEVVKVNVDEVIRNCHQFYRDEDNEIDLNKINSDKSSWLSLKIPSGYIVKEELQKKGNNRQIVYYLEKREINETI